MLTVIDNHSVDLERLTDGPVLDVGCRGFRFAKFFAERGHMVYALDPDLEVQDPKIPNVVYTRYALVGGAAMDGKLVMTADPEARYVVERGALVDLPTRNVQCIGLAQITPEKGALWDLIKLNCEGAEFDLLNSWPGPIARQIVVSFHEHVGTAKRGEKAVNELIERMTRWYDVLRHEWDERYCAGRNAWDTVLALRGEK